MRRTRRRFLERARFLKRDDGMTMIELSISIGLLGIVIAALFATLNSAQTNLGREMSRSDSNDEVRLAAGSLDREVRSGNVLYDPAVENLSSGDVAPGMSLRIETQSNEPTRGDQAWCDQWRITSTGQLQERRWLSGMPGW